MTFDPQALYNAVRPFTDQLMEEAELVRREHPNNESWFLIGASSTGAGTMNHVDVWLVWMRLEFGTPPQVIASEQGESLPMLVHLLTTNGEPGLAVRLAGAALAGRA